MIRRFAATAVWMLVAFFGLALGIDGLVEGLELLGLSLTEAATVTVGLSSAVLVILGTVSVGVLGYRGRLPWTGRREPAEAHPHVQPSMGVLPAVVGVGLLASSMSAIVAATVSTAYVTELRDRQERAGEVDWVITVESEVLREARDLRIRLPVGYDTSPDRRYAILLVLDGGWQLDHTAGAVEVLESLGLVEPMIVVGVVNGVGGRNMDFVPPGSRSGSVPGRGDRFLEFLETEAIPALDRDLRTTSTRLIAGHSLGGLFVTYSLIERPELFEGRFVFSPSWWVRDRHIISELGGFLDGGDMPPTYLYLSLGALESDGMRGAFEAGRSLLERKAPANLVWQAELTGGAGHLTNPVRSTPMALRGFGEFRSGLGETLQGRGSGS